MTNSSARSLKSFHRKAAAERAKGKARRCLWAYREDWPAILEYVEKLTSLRDIERHYLAENGNANDAG